MVTLRLLRLDARAQGPSDPAEVIAAAGVDVAALFGAPSGLRWRSRCAALGRRSGLVTVTGGRTASGVLLLSSPGVDVDAARDLSTGHGPTPPGAAIAALRRLDAPFVLVAARQVSGAGYVDVCRAAERLVPARPPIVACFADATGNPLDDGYRAVAPGVVASAGVEADAVGDGIVELRLP